MKIRYETTATPTKYSGVLFRSRLESLWARRFDQARIKWRYEPFLVGSWLPDFALDFTHKDDKWVFVCEVKPFVFKTQWFYYNEDRYNKYLEMGYIDDSDLKNHVDWSWTSEGKPDCLRLGLLGMTNEASDLTHPMALFGDGFDSSDYALAPFTMVMRIGDGLS
jgi:hypothetical protein